jgi:hypothetical protein
MKMFAKTVVSIVTLSIGVSGCSVTPKKADPNYALFVDAQKSAAASYVQNPLLRMKALPGQTITLSGVEEFVVFSPEVGNRQGNNTIQQYVTPRNDFVELGKAALGVIGTVGGIVAVGNATKGLASAVGASANHGYQYVQVPQPNMTIGGNGTIGSGSYTASTIGNDGAIGGTSLKMDGGASGVLGGGTYSSLAGPGVVGDGAYNSLDGGAGVVGSGGYNPDTSSHDNNNSYPTP